jgi:hypothetical protein
LVAFHKPKNAQQMTIQVKFSESLPLSLAPARDALPELAVRRVLKTTMSELITCDSVEIKTAVTNRG